VKNRIRVLLEEVRGALQRALGLVELILLKLADAEREPVVARAALRDELGQDLLRAREALMLEELLREDAAAVEIVLVLVPVLLEPGKQVLEADRDRPALVVGHLHRRTIEAEQLPHLVVGDDDRALLELRQEVVGELRHRNHDEGVGRDGSLKRARWRDDGRAALDLKARKVLLLLAVGRHGVSLL
jgi:hypothetical protein